MWLWYLIPFFMGLLLGNYLGFRSGAEHGLRMLNDALDRKLKDKEEKNKNEQ